MRHLLRALFGGALVVLHGCSCAAGSPTDGGAADAGRDAFRNEAGNDAFVECPLDASDDPPTVGICVGVDHTTCQSWAEVRLPGYDVSATCLMPATPCIRADDCQRVDGTDGGVCHCGDGPACEPGYVCARSPGDPGPRACLCGTGPP